MQSELAVNTELRDLMAKKRKLLTRIKRTKRKLAKTRLEKSKINEAIRASKERFSRMTSDEARDAVAVELDGISTDEIFPKNLERNFDRLDRQGPKKDERQVIDLTGHAAAGEDSGSNTRIHNESDGDVVVVASAEAETPEEDGTDDLPDIDISEDESQDDEGVIDLSDE